MVQMVSEWAGRSLLMKIMSSGIGVFFIQKECSDWPENTKIIP